MNNTIEKKQLVYYSLIAIPLAILGFPLYIYLPTFYATNVGIDIALVGIILFIARTTDVITDPIFGHLSDLCVKHFKSRKPLMILGSIILINSFYFLINPNENYASLWLFSFSILIYIGWSMITIPYLTWSSEISTNYYDKTLLNSSRELFTILGLVIALLIPYFYKVSSNPQETLDILFIYFIILFTIFFAITIFKMKVSSKVESTSFKLKELLSIYTKIPQLKELQIGYFFNNLANALPATMFLLFMKHIIENEEQSGAILILYFISGVIALPLWTKLSKNIGKKKVWMASIILASSAFVFVPFLSSGDLVLFSIISFISGLSLGADLAFPASIQADIAQEVKTNLKEDISGLLFGIWSMITKLSLALSVMIAFGLLGLIGFDENNPSSLSLYTISFLYGLLPVILKLVSLYFIKNYKDNI